MLRLFRNKKAQSTAEYAILIGLVVAAVVGMQTYVKRGIQGRYKDAADASVAELNTPESQANWDLIGGNPLANLSTQYEPVELSARSTSITSRGSSDASQMRRGGQVTRTTTQTTTQSDADYQQQRFRDPGNQNPPG